jgi:F-type H+-transporting ATPase subunit epsilon
MAQDLTVRVITPDAIVLDTTTSAVQLPGLDGLIGVLPKHAPMVAALAEGALTFTGPGGGKTGMFVAGGFAEVRQNTVRIVSQASESPSDIDVDRATKAAERARDRLRERRVEAGTEEFDDLRAQAALRRALARAFVKNAFHR